MPPTAVESLPSSGGSSLQGLVSHQYRSIAVLDRSSTGSSSSIRDNDYVESYDVKETSNQRRRPFPFGLVLDHFCNNDNSLLNAVDAIRSTLPLDSKRPTVDRRFYCDADRYIATALQDILYEAIDMILCSKQSMIVAAEVATGVEEPTLVQAQSGHGTTSCGDDGDADAYAGDKKNRLPPQPQSQQQSQQQDRLLFSVHCNQYLRILEYHSIGGRLAPHTDGTKVCDVTQRRSTHTLLLYLTDCEVGGETVILDGRSGWSTPQTSVTVIPRDRIYNDPSGHSSDSGSSNKQCGSTTTAASSTIINSADIAMTTFIHRIKLDAYEQSLDKTARKTKNDNGDDYNCAGTATGARTNSGNSHVSIGITPRRGRIFVMPHAWPHAGAPCQSVPKIMLRAEVTIELPV